LLLRGDYSLKQIALQPFDESKMGSRQTQTTIDGHFPLEMAALEMTERFYEIGSPAGIEELSLMLKK